MVRRVTHCSGVSQELEDGEESLLTTVGSVWGERMVRRAYSLQWGQCGARGW